MDLNKTDPTELYLSAQSQKERVMLVYASFGFAGFWIQALEQTLENMILIGTLKEKNIIDQEVLDWVENLSRSKDTMGRLLKKVKTIYSMSELHLQQLSEILEQRNYLIHHFFGKSTFKWHIKDGMLEMILECNEFAMKAQVMDKQLDGYYKKYLQLFGLTEEDLKKAFELKKNEELKKREDNSTRAPL